MTELTVQTLTHLIENYGLVAVFLLMTAESALIPIPSEITMPFAGFLAGRGIMNFWLVVFIGALGNLVGSLLAYWLGWTKGERWVKVAIKRWGKLFLVKVSEFNQAKSWFRNYGQLVTFGSRLVPVVRAFISLPAGIAKMNIFLFSVLVFIGSLIWSGCLAWLGLKLGENWLIIEPFLKKFQILIVGLVVTAVVIYVWSRFRKKG